VQLPGLQEFNLPPGAYGEYIPLDERRLTQMRNPGSPNAPIDVRALQAMAQRQLVVRDFDRRRVMAWSLLQSGNYAATDRMSVVGQTLQFTPQTYNAPFVWSNLTQSTPLADIRNLSFFDRGTSAKFDQGSTLWMNRSQLFYMYSNNNPADLGGRRDNYGATFNTLTTINSILSGEGLPTIVPYDEGFYDDAGTFNLFLATGKAVVIGRRPNNDPIGQFIMSRNVNNDDFAPGVYTRVVDKQIDSAGARTIEHHRGWNGACAILYPRAVGVLNC
jgi:hypothetical protein